MFRVGVDIGGTFTDLFAWEEGTSGARTARTAKVLTAPDDPSIGVTNALRKADIAPFEISRLIHGTALWKSSTAVEDVGELSLAGDGTWKLTAPSGSAELTLELSTSPSLDVYATPVFHTSQNPRRRHAHLSRRPLPHQ